MPARFSVTDCKHRAMRPRASRSTISIFPVERWGWTRFEDLQGRTHSMSFPVRWPPCAREPRPRVELDKEQEVLPPVEKYVDAVCLSLLNLLVIGPLVHTWLAGTIISRRHSPIRMLLGAAGCVLVHSGLYAFVHRGMHRVRAFRPMHAPHHQFATDVVPTVANAVSPCEFLLAYMAPFVIAAHLLRVEERSVNLAATVVSAANLVVHSAHLAPHRFPESLVSPRDHLEHHRTRSRKYSAPTFAWFRLLQGRNVSDKDRNEEASCH